MVFLMPAFFAHVQKALVCPAERSKEARLPPVGVGGAGEDDLGGGGADPLTQHYLGSKLHEWNDRIVLFLLD